VDPPTEPNGQDPDQQMQQMLSEALAEARARAERALEGLRCPYHDEPVRYVTQESSDPGTEYIGRVEACCERARKMGKAVVRRAMRTM
jgi:hypothetical protein